MMLGTHVLSPSLRDSPGAPARPARQAPAPVGVAKGVVAKGVAFDEDYAALRRFVLEDCMLKPKHLEVLVENEVDLLTLLICDEQDLAGIGLKAGPRIKMKQKIKQCQRTLGTDVLDLWSCSDAAAVAVEDAKRRATRQPCSQAESSRRAAAVPSKPCAESATQEKVGMQAVPSRARQPPVKTAASQVGTHTCTARKQSMSVFRTRSGAGLNAVAIRPRRRGRRLPE
jgi:hypothetical protein